jgi:hypothetical protein
VLKNQAQMSGLYNATECNTLLLGSNTLLKPNSDSKQLLVALSKREVSCTAKQGLEKRVDAAENCKRKGQRFNWLDYTQKKQGLQFGFLSIRYLAVVCM